MSYLLRHGAKEENVKITQDGFVEETDLINWLKRQGFSVSHDMLKRIVDNCPKQRFFMERRGFTNYYRANQGHTLSSQEVKVRMDIISNLDEFVDKPPVHGTYFKTWNVIKKDGLNRMKRQHIHLATGDYKDRSVKSGMRSDVEVLVYIDIHKAISDGIVFYRSSNNVILTEGIDGILEPKYFLRVINTKTGEELTF